MAKLTYVICSIILIIPSIYTGCTIPDAKNLLKRTIYEFSADLVTRIGQDTDYHFVSSPLSVWTLLACASLGATDDTLSEMRQVLNLHAQKCFNNRYLRIVQSVTNFNDTDVFLERSSVIFLHDKMPVLEKYERKLSKSNLSSIVPISFEDVESAAITINDYVNRSTHETIDEVVTPGDLENVLMVMIDALFFKGAWSNPFPRADTVKSPFYDHMGKEVGEVLMMNNMDQYNFASMKLIEAHVLEVPYGKGRRFSMLFFLPFQDVPLFTVIDKLKLISLTSIRSVFKTYGSSSVRVQIPRFKITSDLSNMKELLIDMGIKAAFSENKARFSIIEDNDVFISNFIQKADIEVTEEGTVASAATAAQFSFRTSPGNFVADKPFLFMIIDNKHEIPIFAGAFSKPKVF